MTLHSRSMTPEIGMTAAEEMEMEVDNEEQDNTQHPSNKRPHQSMIVVKQPSLPASMASLSANTPSSSARTLASSSHMISQDSQTSLRTGQKKTAHKCSLSGRVQSGTLDVLDQVGSLTDDMSYIYSVKESAPKYKIAKVNALHHEHNI
ncbi:uncharacterized protein F5147DRAFT_780294 [Suillus discolor]|uniref:Uncharacterized protein n=1 Tax=Suillus discolor TaxID=1912936 RepID=A0A9P7ETN3_9AGAM|nr:uncharacterized protein F5147DRAFT_780294 [Suillus discolor]KAG2090486.1 hypothetical protein F5147DRAFT_780294 [Suillus discolor]